MKSYSIGNPHVTGLVRPDGRWHGGALVGVESVVNYRAIAQLNLACLDIDDRHGVFPPVVIHRHLLLALNRLRVVVFVDAVREIFTSMGPAALLPGFGRPC